MSYIAGVGEFIEFGAEYAYVLCSGARFTLGITEDRELLLTFSGSAIHTLGYCNDAPLPPEDSDEHDRFNWEKWATSVLMHVDRQGLLPESNNPLPESSG